MNTRALRPALPRWAIPRVVVGLVVGLVWTVLVAPAAWASEEDESKQAVDLVQQTVALIANGVPGDRVLESARDALAAPDTSGVDVGAVRQAVQVLQSNPDDAAARDKARTLLIQASPVLGKPPATRMATGATTGTTAVLDPFEPARGISGTEDWVLVLLALAAIAGGIALSRLWRPRHRIRELRRAGVTEAAPGGRR